MTLTLAVHIVHANAPDLSKKDKMDFWLEKLEMQESGGQELTVELDVNHKYSYGCLRFQMGTWEQYSKKYGVNAEIMDCKAQKQVAYDMIADDYNMWRAWFNSTLKIGKPPA